MSKSFDVVVIGGGPGGYVAAIRASQLGLSVALIEKYQRLGGTCLNVGCIPSKALLKSTEHYHQAHTEFSKHGIEVEGLKINMPQMIQRKREVVEQITGGVDFLIEKNNIQRFVGMGKLTGKNSVEVNGESLEVKNIIIATGSKPTPLRGLDFDKKRIISSTEALEIDALPKDMVIIGAGVIGLEMGSVWARLGVKVTIVEYGKTVLPGMDKHVQRQMQKSMKELGVEFVFGCGVNGGEVKKDRVYLTGKGASDDKEYSFEADYCLVAIGRRPYTDTLGLDNAGVEMDERGFVKIDDHWRTNVSNIYAIGDVVGGLMLAHKAEEEGIAAAEVIAGKPGHVNYNAIPGVVYTHPEVAVVGKTEEQLKEAGIPFNVGKFNFAANGRAVASNEAVGFVKIIAHKETDEILGAHMIGPNVSEMIQEMSLALEYKAASEDVGITSHAHPTLSEAVKEAALACTKRAIHAI
ncbi:MAG: dihydrolipoyl dehydrogenase [Bdellovibrionota bacterium]